LTENQLAYLDLNALTKLKQIKSLYLNKNKLTSLPESIFNGLVDLELLDMSINNQLVRRFDELERTTFGI